MMPTCPLCASTDHAPYHRDARRDYRRCRRCALVFVPAHQRLGPAEEKAVYDQHENSPDDPGYRRFLARLFDPLAAELPPGARGLERPERRPTADDGLRACSAARCRFSRQ